MAFVLLSSAASNGLGQKSAQLLLSLRQFEALTPPVSEADMRNEVENGQPAPFMTDSDWLALVAELGNLPLDESSLTNSERSIINTLRSIVAPPPQLACCGTTIPADLDGNTSIAGFQNAGTTTKYQIQMTLDKVLTCDIKKIELTLVGAPAVTSANPMELFFDRCNTDGNMLWSILNVTFAADPTGNSYDVSLDFLDADNVSITSYAVTDYQLNL